MPRKSIQPLDLLKAAMALSAERGWPRVTLFDIAERAKMPFSELYKLAPSKHAVIALFRRHIDQEMLRAVEAEREAPSEGAEMSIRDRLFDILMARFDALAPYRDGVKSIFSALACDPLALACDCPSRERSMRAVLEAVGVDTGGFSGVVRVQVISLVWIDAFRVWLEEGEGDHGKTMARLDQDLAKTEALARKFAGYSTPFCPSARRKEAHPSS